ncbi:hypothetical protein ZWY2020_048783 [Hordeum vulgare]|nr:hypothetical protein ZWY2020_048783 [Hordeum vulgare]
MQQQPSQHRQKYLDPPLPTFSVPSSPYFPLPGSTHPVRQLRPRCFPVRHRQGIAHTCSRSFVRVCASDGWGAA